VRDWLGEAEIVDRDRGLAELARRYLAGHGPASDRDLAIWAGITLRDARAGLGAICSELRDAGGGLVDLLARDAAAPLPPPRLLGPFDPVLHGWRDRTWVAGEHAGIVTVNGIFRPILLVGGRAAGIWSMPGGEVRLQPFAPLRRADRTALEADGADALRFLGR
jgi:hypothetical protein